jgi:hypothetical protein
VRKRRLSQKGQPPFFVAHLRTSVRSPPRAGQWQSGVPSILRPRDDSRCYACRSPWAGHSTRLRPNEAT